MAQGICSPSHLSYFEKGKKQLREEIIQALLQRLNLSPGAVADIGQIRHLLLRLATQVERLDYELAAETYAQLKEQQPIIQISPYALEFQVYHLLYQVFVARLSFEELIAEFQLMDRITPALKPELQCLYFLVSGKAHYDGGNHREGIRRLETALQLKETPWINYRLGVAYTLAQQPLTGLYYLEKALANFESSGQFINVLQCHSFLGQCCTELKLYDRGERHYLSIITGSEYLAIPPDLWGAYGGLARLELERGNFQGAMDWAEKSMAAVKDYNSTPPPRWIRAFWNSENTPLLGVAYWVEASHNLGRRQDCVALLQEYLRKENSPLRYYKYLEFLLLYITGSEELYPRSLAEFIPYYQQLGYLNILRSIKLKLIGHLESQRRYKEATKLYRDLLSR